MSSTIDEDAQEEFEEETAMKVVSFTTELTLTEEEKARLIFHSFANLLNVLLDVIGKCKVVLNIVDGAVFDETLRIVSEIGKSLTSITNTIGLLFQLPALKVKIVQELENAKQLFTQYEKSQSSVSGTKISSISKSFWKDVRWIESSLLPIVEIRTKELTQRLTLPGDAWVMYKIETLKRNMETVLLAVAKGTVAVSGIVFKEADRAQPTDMVVNLSFQGVQEGSIHLPPVFQDVMRDLIMNARKYSLPGASIDASMVNDGTQLILTIKDNGMGIEEGEISHIIEFGVRGSNVASRRTLGGGFGLTKAYFFTKQFNGTFTVASAIGVGSVFTITIPCPASFRLVLPPKPVAATPETYKEGKIKVPLERSAFTATPKDNEAARLAEYRKKKAQS